MTNTAANGINPAQPSKRKNSSMIKETLLLFLLFIAFLLLVVATVTNVHGLARLSAISATLFSLPSQNYQHQEAANPTEKLSLNKTHIDSSSVNLVLKENPKIENLLPGWFKNSSETHEFAKSGDIEVSKSHNTATPSPLPAFQAGNRPLLCSNNSGIPSFTPPWDSPELSIQTREPLLINHGTTQLPSPLEYPIVPSNKINQGDALDHSLERTADENKTVIIITLNSAWAEKGSMIDLFFESFRNGEGTKDLLDHLLVVAVDAKAYDRCIKIHPHCYILRTQGVDFSAEKTYMTQDYLKMMWRRLEFLGDVLKRGYNFVFSDTDIMWLRIPFPIFSEDADFQIASDFFFGNPEDTRNRPNCGFKFVRSNYKTITFYQNWYRSRLRYPGKNEQDVINILKVQSSFKELNMKFMFLDTKNFGGFCVRSPYIDEAYTMHATCCKGLKAKLIDLRTALDEFISSRKNVTLKLQGTRVKWSAPKACPRSWSH